MKTFPQRQAAKTITEQLGKLIQSSTGTGTGRGFKSYFWGGAGKTDQVNTHGTDMIKAWGKGGMSASDIAWGHILPTASHTVSTLGMLVSQPLL